MSEPDLSTLPKRMRFAAEVLKEARETFHSRPENDRSGWLANHWTSSDLLNHAAAWERADAAKAAEDADLRQLTVELQSVYSRVLQPSSADWAEQEARIHAQQMVSLGWRRGPIDD